MAAANAVRGERKVSIGGTELLLVPSFGRLAKVEAACGRSIVQILQEIGTHQRVTVTDTVAMVELLCREPKLKTDQIGALVVREGVVKVLGVLAAVLGSALTGDDDEKETGDDATGKGDGDESSSG